MSNTLDGVEDFLTKVEKAHDLVNLLKSEDAEVVKNTQDEIDTILCNDWEDVECWDGFSKSSINKTTGVPAAPQEVVDNPEFPPDQAGFMRAVAEDAEKRAASRKKKEEKAKIRKDKGNEAFKKGDYDEAIKQYDIAIKLTGWNVSLYTNKAQSYIKLKEYDKAIEACDRALYIEDDFVKGYVQKSNALIAKESYSEAVDCLNLCTENCKGSSGIIKKYLNKANNLLIQQKDTTDILETSDPEQRKEFEHLLEKLRSDKMFEVTISADFLNKSLQNSNKNIRLFRALGGIQVATQQIAVVNEHLALTSILDVLKICLINDRISLYSWLYQEDTWSKSLAVHFSKDKHRLPIVMLIQKLVFEDDKICEIFLEHWLDTTLIKHFVECFNRPTTQSLTILIVGQLIRNSNFLARFRRELTGCLKTMSNSLPQILSADISCQRTWVAGLSGLSMTTEARKHLDSAFWNLFLPLLEIFEKSGDVKTVDDLLATGHNFALDSEVLGAPEGPGDKVTKVLVRLCGEDNNWERAPLLLNRVLEKCPNTALTEDKAQFSSLLKVIKNNTSLDEDLNTAIKLLTRTTAVSPQARKWVVKYQVLEKLLEILSKGEVTTKSPKIYTAIMSNAALCCAHCFQDESVCKKSDVDLIDLMLRHARSDKGLAIQQNSAIALARLATNSPTMLVRLRELGGLEVLHSRYSQT